MSPIVTVFAIWIGLVSLILITFFSRYLKRDDRLDDSFERARREQLQ